MADTMRKNTDAEVRGGAARSSVEALVMGVERRGGVIPLTHVTNLRCTSTPSLPGGIGHPVAIDELRPFGVERAVEHGEYLFRAGDATYDFVVMLEGSAEILRVDDAGETVIAVLS